jgi:hypothetical protein
MKPLALHVETIRQLNGDQIEGVAGGTEYSAGCEISGYRTASCRPKCPGEMLPQF